VPFEWQDEVIRAAITMKMGNFEETGAIVAAMTTSVPNSPAGNATSNLPDMLSRRKLRL